MRDLIFEKLYEWSKKPYQKFFKKNEAWKVTPKELLLYPQGSLGLHLGCFLQKNHFDIQPKLEDHDIFHVLTNTGVTVREEIGMQFYLLGNGKKSAYLFVVIFMGMLFYPLRFKTFRNCFKRGQKAHQFHDLNFEKMLLIPLQNIQTSFNIK